MFRAVIALLLSGLASADAEAGGLVVWMEQNVPDEATVKKAGKLVDVEFSSVAYSEFALLPQPAGPDDGGRYDTLRAAMTSGKSRWTEFEVELPIAGELEEILSSIDVVRDRRDRDDLVAARLFQGAAASIAFEPDEFLDDARAAPYRKQLPGMRVNRPWLFAMGMDPGRDFVRGDVADGGSYPELKATQDRVNGLPGGVLDFASVPRELTVVLDGIELHAGTETAAVRPGVHYVHVLVHGLIAGRAKLEVEPGATVKVPVLVDRGELEGARAAVIAGSAANLPADVKTAVDAVARTAGGPVYLGAVDEKGRAVLVPFTENAQLVKQRPVTFLVTGEIGGTALSSPMFRPSGTEAVVAPGAHGGLGFEFGIYNAAIIGGCDLAFTPTQTISYSQDGENHRTSVMPAPWGGVGVYPLRPNGDGPTLLIAGVYGWDAPAHLAMGGRLTLGIPVDDGTWFRITVGGNTSPQPIAKWDEWREGRDMPLHVGFARFGFGARF